MAFYDPSKGFEQGENYAGKEISLASRDKLLEALQAQAMSSDMRGAGRYGWAQALAKLGTAYFANKGIEDNEAERTELGRNRQANLSQNLGAYMDLSQGRVGETMTDQQAGELMNNDVAPELADPVKANPKEAVVRAMASQHPELQRIGQLQMMEMAKRKEQKPTYVMGQNGDMIRTDGDKPQVVGNYAKPGDKFGETYYEKDADGRPLLMVKNLTTNEPKALDRAAKVNVNSNVSNIAAKGATKAAEALGKEVPEVLSGARKIVTDSQNAINSAQQLYQLASSPDLITGFAAEPLTALANLGTKLGFTGPNAAAQTQAAMSAMAQQTLSQVKRLPGAITEKERPFLEMAAAGKIDFTPETMKHLAGLSMATSHNDLLEAFKQYGGAASLEGAEAGKQMYPMPQVKYNLDPSMFTEIGNDRVRYKGQLPGMGGVGKANAAAPRNPNRGSWD